MIKKTFKQKLCMVLISLIIIGFAPVTAVAWPDNTVAIAIFAWPENGGTVSITPIGGGIDVEGWFRTLVEVDSTVTLRATPNSGWVFEGWFDGYESSATAGQLVSSNAVYSFTATQTRALYAQFTRQQQQTVQIATTAGPPNSGTISMTPSGGTSQADGWTYTTVESNSTVTLRAAPNSGWELEGWFEQLEDGSAILVSTDTTFSFTATQRRAIIARFRQARFTVTASASPANGGSVSGGGSFNQNAQVSLQATPNNGWTFDGWFENGERVNSNTNWSFNATSNRTVQARFSQSTLFEITATASPTNGGSVSGGGSFISGANVSLRATPNTGWAFDGWFENSSRVNSNATWSFTATQNRTLQARFTQTMPNSSLSASPATPNFGSHALGYAQQPAQTVSITNTGTQNVTLNTLRSVSNWTLTQGSNWTTEMAPGQTRTFTIRPNSGLAAGTYEPSISITGSGGTSVQIQPTFSVTGAGNDETYAWTAMNPFVDVFPNDWFYDDVLFINNNGLMRGTSATQFEPRANLNRAMVVTILYRMVGEPVSAHFSNPFTDVPSGEWYTNAVQWAFANGIVVGDGSRFRPNDDITRQDFAVILHRYATDYSGLNPTMTQPWGQFVDAADIADYASSAMQSLNRLGVINGYENRINPRGNASRAEAAAMFHRFRLALIFVSPALPFS